MSSNGISRAPRTPRVGLGRALCSSLFVHFGVLGAGIVWGLLLPGWERARARQYSATFAPSESIEVSAEEREPLELVPDEPKEAREPELHESEVWAEPETLFALEEPEVDPELLGAPRMVDWIAHHPFEIGKLGQEPCERELGATTGQEPAHEPLADPAPAKTTVAPPAGPLVAEPVPLATPQPDYPRLSRRTGEEGSVLCRLHLAVDGSVVEVEIVESSGHERLDQAASAALAGWRFEPRREDGQPVAALILHRVTFRLRAG